MRVTQQLRVDAGIRSVQATQADMEKLRLQIASGKRIQQPSDDPQGTERSISLRTYLGAVRGTLYNLDLSNAWMEATAASLNDFVGVISKMRLQAEQAANDTFSDADRQSMAEGVKEALEQAVDFANSDDQGRYLFAGFQTQKKPFVLDPDTLNVSYAGDGGAIRHEFEPGSTVQVNVAGDQPMFTQGFTALRDLYNSLKAGDATGLQSAIKSMDSCVDLSLQQSSVIGYRISSLETSRNRLDEFEVSLQSQISAIEDTDIAEATVQLSASEQQYQATLVNLANNKFVSLFDYLG